MLGAVLLMAGCYYDTEAELYPDRFCDTTNVTWSATIQPIIQGNCAIPGCHVTGGTDPDLTTYLGVKVEADNGTLRQEVVVDRTIPKNSVLNPCAIDQIDAWIQAGAPEN